MFLWAILWGNSESKSHSIIPNHFYTFHEHTREDMYPRNNPCLPCNNQLGTLALFWVRWPTSARSIVDELMSPLDRKIVNGKVIAWILCFLSARQTRVYLCQWKSWFLTTPEQKAAENSGNRAHPRRPSSENRAFLFIDRHRVWRQGRGRLLTPLIGRKSSSEEKALLADLEIGDFSCGITILNSRAVK